MNKMITMTKIIKITKNDQNTQNNRIMFNFTITKVLKGKLIRYIERDANARAKNDTSRRLIRNFLA